nr:hypothetical protein [uncultured Cohaesibacter sp.]
MKDSFGWVRGAVGASGFVAQADNRIAPLRHMAFDASMFQFVSRTFTTHVSL